MVAHHRIGVIRYSRIKGEKLCQISVALFWLPFSWLRLWLWLSCSRTSASDPALLLSRKTFGAGEERDEIRDTVREYLLEHPEVIVEALEALQNRRHQADKARKRGALAASRDALVNDSRDPFIGNPGAGITLVEFFDYQCPYCKRMAQVLAAIADEDSDLRIVFKELPVFGEPSALAPHWPPTSRASTWSFTWR